MTDSEYERFIRLEAVVARLAGLHESPELVEARKDYEAIVGRPSSYFAHGEEEYLKIKWFDDHARFILGLVRGSS